MNDVTVECPSCGRSLECGELDGGDDFQEICKCGAPLWVVPYVIANADIQCNVDNPDVVRSRAVEFQIRAAALAHQERGGHGNHGRPKSADIYRAARWLMGMRENEGPRSPPATEEMDWNLRLRSGMLELIADRDKALKRVKGVLADVRTCDEAVDGLMSQLRAHRREIARAKEEAAENGDQLLARLAKELRRFIDIEPKDVSSNASTDPVDRAVDMVRAASDGIADHISCLAYQIDALASALRLYRALPKIPPGTGGSSVPFVRALVAFEHLCDDLLVEIETPTPGLWGIWCVQEDRWCGDGAYLKMQRLEALAELPGWILGEASALGLDHGFTYQVRPYTEKA